MNFRVVDNNVINLDLKIYLLMYALTCKAIRSMQWLVKKMFDVIAIMKSAVVGRVNARIVC